MDRTIIQPGALRDFQDAFAAALLERPGQADRLPPAITRIAAQPGFAVYRNTVMKGCIDALEANYPAVARAVGQEWFRAAAVIYAHDHPPRRPTLLYYGADFAAFIESFEPARELPYLPGLARLDRYWTEAHAAIDETPVDPAEVVGQGNAALAQVVLCPHASARWTWFEAQPIATIWRRNRATHKDTIDDDIDWHGEGLLIVRPRDGVENIDLDAAGCAFLDACAAGNTLLGAAMVSLEVDAAADISRLIAALLQAGAFGSMCVARISHTTGIS